MDKYLGIIKLYDDGMSGTSVKLLSKTYNDLHSLKKWLSLYPNSEYVVLNNTQKLDSMFEIFRDMTPITEEEKQEMENTKMLLRNLKKYID